MATKPKTTAVATKASTNIVSIKDALKVQVAEQAGRIAPATGSTIRITQDKFFVLPDGTKTQGPLELVVVDFASKNAYYPDGFDPKNITPPTCFAIGTDIRSLVPSANSPINQNAGGDCASCPMNQWESDPKGGKGKACKNSRALAVLPPDADADTPLWLLNVSPTATKGFDGFVSGVARVFELPPIGVVVTVGFNPNETYAQLVFSDPKPNENLAVHFSRQAEATALLTVEPDVSGWVAPAKNARGKVAARR
jgi:hypothetical protein